MVTQIDDMDKRKFRRYNTFIQLTLSVPASRTSKVFEVIGWTKDVSREGIGLEIYILSSDKIDRLARVVTNKQPVTISIPFLDEFSIEARCKIVWDTFSENRMPYNLGLQILRLGSDQSDKWDFFIEELSQKNFLNIKISPDRDQ